MKQITLWLLLIGLISCGNHHVDKDLERSFISSYSPLEEECVHSVSELLQPFVLENDTIKIDKVYLLEVNGDTNLYSGAVMAYNYFLGIKLMPDRYDPVIICIDMRYGALTTCQVYEDNILIINNCDYLFTDLSGLIGCSGLNIPDSLLNFTLNSKPMFRQLVWTSSLYGDWQVETGDDPGFATGLFNNSWTFTPDNGFILKDSGNDTLLIDQVELQGNRLRLIRSGYAFEIATQSGKKILIKEKDADRYIFLVRKD